MRVIAWFSAVLLLGACQQLPSGGANLVAPARNGLYPYIENYVCTPLNGSDNQRYTLIHQSPLQIQFGAVGQAAATYTRANEDAPYTLSSNSATFVEFLPPYQGNNTLALHLNPPHQSAQTLNCLQQ